MARCGPALSSRAARAVAEGRRRLAVVALEGAREVQRIAEAGLLGDLADRAVGEAQQAGGLEHHAVGDELLRRLAGDLLSACDSAAGGIASASA